jgi:DNA-binding beta-propeller fold protein YncE
MFNVPTGVVADPAGSFLYVTEYGNNRVQRFSLQTGSFAGAIGDSTASGNCAAGAQSNWCTGGTFSAATIDGGFTNPWGTAIDPSGTYLYVTDATGRLQRFTVSSGAFEGTIGNSTASGTCAAGAQTAWCTGGSFSTGTGDGMLSDLATRPVIDPGANYIYVPDWLNYRVQRFTLAGAFAGAIGNSTASGTCTAGAQTSWCNGGTFSMGTADGEFGGTPDIAIDPSGSFLYVADFPVRVQRFNSP